MDFASILDQWDDMQKSSVKKNNNTNQVSHKKANAPTKEEKEARKQGYSYEEIMNQDNKKTVNPMEFWLNRYGTIDKDKISDRIKETEKLHDIEYLKSLKPQARIDLHQLTRDEAWNRLNSFVTESCRRGLKKILIIHGKGVHSHGSDPVLGPMVKTFIEQDSRLGTFGHPDRNNGGSGATWVLLK